MPKNVAPLLVCLVISLAPLPFGSAEPFWGAVWCALLGVALLLGAGRLGSEVRLRTPILLLLSVVAVWCVIVALQYLPAGLLTPAGPGWVEAGHILGDHPLVPKLAAYGEIPIAAIVPPLSLVMGLLVGLVFGAEPGFAERIYRWVAIAGLFYAGFSIFAEITNPTMLLWREKIAYVDALTGTFVNHNTAAVFFGAVSIIWYLLALRELRRTVDLSRWREPTYIFNKLKNRNVFLLGYALASFFAIATTFMTRSRGGSLLTIAMIGLVTALYFIRELGSARRVLIALAGFAIAGAIVLVAAGGQLTHQIESRGISDVGRVDAWRSSLSIVYDHPWLGTGLGTFAGVFSAYRNPAAGVWGVWDHAHSTPLELLVEMGVPFGLLVFALWSIMLGFLVRAAIRGTGNRLYVIAGAGIGTLATLHSLVDFSLQIPGFSLVCCSLVGTSIAAALVPVEAIRRSDSESATAPVLSWGSVVQASAIAATNGPPERQPASSLTATKGQSGRQPASSLTPTKGSTERKPATSLKATKGSSGRKPASSLTATKRSAEGKLASSRAPTKGSSERKPATSLIATKGPSEGKSASSPAATKGPSEGEPASSPAATKGPSEGKPASSLAATKGPSESKPS
jgi:O-antigen ligase